MSTIAVVKKNNKIAIGADTLTLLGYNKETPDLICEKSKIVKVKDSYIASVGHASTQLIIQDYFSNNQDDFLFNSSLEIFRMALNFHRVLKEKYYLNSLEDEDDQYESIRMSCLIANPNGIFGLYSLRSVQEYTKFYSFGSGREYALGAMQAVYNESNDAEKIVRIGLEAAATFNSQTGLPLEIYTLDLK